MRGIKFVYVDGTRLGKELNAATHNGKAIKSIPATVRFTLLCRSLSLVCATCEAFRALGMCGINLITVNKTPCFLYQLS